MIKIEHETSSGNVYADIGFPEPVEAQAKAELARKLGSIIKHRHLSQTAAAKLLGIDQPKVSRLLRGQLKEFSMTRLLGFMLRLNRDIEIHIKKHQSLRVPPKIKVMAS